MEDLRRRSTLSFTFILCFSLWLMPGETSTSVKHFTSTYDVECSDRCEKRGSDNYWCHSKKGWDYCSPGENKDYKGNHCYNACGKHGERYYWCKLWGGSWGYCARVEPRAMIYYTRYQRQCVDSCQYYESKDYFWCHDGDDWEYCSPLQDHTYKNEPCRFNHYCGSYGYSYTWCYTTYNNDWDYCGVGHPGVCRFSQTSRARRQTNNRIQICTFREEGSSSNIAPINRGLRNEALDLINQWEKNQRLSDQARSNLIRSRRLRIDNQGSFTRNNQRCYNLQIQINEPRPSGGSTTVAQIIVPVDTSAEYMCEAFKQSLKARSRVVVEVQQTEEL